MQLSLKPCSHLYAQVLLNPVSLLCIKKLVALEKVVQRFKIKAVRLYDESRSLVIIILIFSQPTTRKTKNRNFMLQKNYDDNKTISCSFLC